MFEICHEHLFSLLKANMLFHVGNNVQCRFTNSDSACVSVRLNNFQYCISDNKDPVQVPRLAE